MTMRQQTYRDRRQLVAALVNDTAAVLSRAIKKNGRASMAVSGGSTPKPLFERLSTLDIPWNHVVISLVDERWVEPDANDSNQRLVRVHLLQNRAATATFIGMKNDAPTAAAGESRCERRLRQIPRPFDLVILGMGNDGHTASLFPGAEQLDQATDMDSRKICMAIRPPAASHERMTLTLPAILASRQIFIHIVGPGKREALAAALADGTAAEMPIRYILRQSQVPVTVFWAP